MSKTRTRHSKEFKLEAVRLTQEPERSVASVASELGVSESMLYRWRAQFGDVASGTPAKQESPEQAEIRRLRQELAQAREDVVILKKATTFFASQKKSGSSS